MIKTFFNLSFPLAVTAFALTLFCVPAGAQMLNTLLPSPKGGTKAAAPAPTSPTNITSEEMDIDMKNDVITLTDNVVIDDEGTHMTADKMEIHLKDKNAKGAAGGQAAATDSSDKEVRSIIATGNVVIIKKQNDNENKSWRKVLAGKAVYNAEDGTILLTEDPVIFVINDNSPMKGQKITIWRDNERMKVEGGSSFTHVPDQDAGVDSAQKPNHKAKP